jgi:peroxiredoxin
MQLVRLQANWAKVTGANATAVAISVDPPDKARELAELFKLPFPVLSDPQLEVVRRWGLEHAEIARPAAFVVDADRVVLHAAVDPDWVDGVLASIVSP